MNDHKQDHAVPRQGSDIQETNRNGDPHLGCCQAWDTRQEEYQRLIIGSIELQHNEGLRQQEYLND